MPMVSSSDSPRRSVMPTSAAHWAPAGAAPVGPPARTVSPAGISPSVRRSSLAIPAPVTRR